MQDDVNKGISPVVTPLAADSVNKQGGDKSPVAKSPATKSPAVKSPPAAYKSPAAPVMSPLAPSTNAAAVSFVYKF